MSKRRNNNMACKKNENWTCFDLAQHQRLTGKVGRFYPGISAGGSGSKDIWYSYEITIQSIIPQVMHALKPLNNIYGLK